MNSIQILLSQMADIAIDDKSTFIHEGDYFITITLQPAMYKLTAYSQLKSTIKNVETTLKRYCDRFIVIPELTNKTNIHFHGIVKFRSGKFISEACFDAFKGVANIGYVQINDSEISEQNINRTWDYLFKDYTKTIIVLYNNRKNKPITFVPYLKHKETTLHDIIKKTKHAIFNCACSTCQTNLRIDELNFDLLG